MKDDSNWKESWEAKFASNASDYEADRGTGKRDDILDRLSTAELLEFIDPHPTDVVFDAGCGTGMNVVLLHDRVGRIVAIDFAESAVQRAKSRAAAAGITNVEFSQGDILRTNLADGSVDKILCLSVFHYLTDEQVRDCLRSFKRVLRDGGVVILHVKNLASLYLSTLLMAKQLLRLAGWRPNLSEHFRTFNWYCRELRAAGFEIEAFNSFNVLVLERMPRRLIESLQRLELSQRRRFPFSTAVVRRLGADLKIRARSSD